MTTPPDAAETARATAGVTRILTRADPQTDPEVLANEIVQALRAHGWRPTNAQPAPGWRIPDGHAAPPTPEWQEARAQLAERRGEGEGWWRT